MGDVDVNAGTGTASIEHEDGHTETVEVIIIQPVLVQKLVERIDFLASAISTLISQWNALAMTMQAGLSHAEKAGRINRLVTGMLNGEPEDEHAKAAANYEKTRAPGYA